MKGGRKKRQQGGKTEQHVQTQIGKEQQGKERVRESVGKKEMEGQGGTTTRNGDEAPRARDSWQLLLSLLPGGF